MKEMKVIITKDSPHSGFGYYKKGDIGLLVGFTEGCAVVATDYDMFVKVRLDNIKKITE